MKKLIVFVIIINLFAKNVSNKIIVGYKKNLINKLEYFTPNFLKISTETSFVNLKIYEDTLSQKTPSASIHINFKLPEFFIKKISTTNKNAKKTSSSSLTFKIRPIIRAQKNKIFFLENIIEYKKTTPNHLYGISNKINFYPFDNYYTDSINFTYLIYSKHTYSINLNLSTNKNDFPTKYYSLNFSISNLHQKSINSYGYKISGNTASNPFIYSHQLYFNYRRALFHKKYIFLEITPYILLSKEYHYEIKTAVTTSINIKF